MKDKPEELSEQCFCRKQVILFMTGYVLMRRRDQKATVNDGLRTAFIAVRRQPAVKCFSEKNNI